MPRCLTNDILKTTAYFMCVYMKTNQIMNYGDQKVPMNKVTMQLTALF